MVHTPSSIQMCMYSLKFIIHTHAPIEHMYLYIPINIYITGHYQGIQVSQHYAKCFHCIRKQHASTCMYISTLPCTTDRNTCVCDTVVFMHKNSNKSRSRIGAVMMQIHPSVYTIYKYIHVYTCMSIAIVYIYIWRYNIYCGYQLSPYV